MLCVAVRMMARRSATGVYLRILKRSVAWRSVGDGCELTLVRPPLMAMVSEGRAAMRKAL